MSLEDYKNIDFRDLVDGKTQNRKDNNLENVEIKNDRQTTSGEIKIPVFIYDNDEFVEAKYQYYFEGEDYRGYPYSKNSIDTTISSDYLLTGLGNNPYIIGYYEESTFENLLEEDALASIDESIKEIHVRRVNERYVLNHQFIGKYSSNGIVVEVDGNIFKIKNNDTNYRIVVANKFSNFEILELYIDDKKEEVSNYTFSATIMSIPLYHGLYIYFEKEGEFLLPRMEYYIKDSPYSAIANL